MGNIDTITKSYVRQPDVFADICNYALFNGDAVVTPECLTERDPNELDVIFKTTDDKEIIIPTQRMRDILRSVVIMSDSATTYMVIGIENQTNIHYAMPVRNMLYDALNYSAQITAIANSNREHSSSGEYDFLSGLNSMDRLAPVVTITVYWGSDGWDAPRSLYDMLDAPPFIRNYISDYKLNLVVPSEIRDFNKFQTDVGCILNLISASGNRSRTEHLFKTNERFQHIDKQAVILINQLLNTNYKVTKSKGGKVNMCKAWDDAMRHSEARGETRGETRGRQTGAAQELLSNVDAISKNTSFSITDALAMLGKTMTDYEDAKEIVMSSSV